MRILAVVASITVLGCASEPEVNRQIQQTECTSGDTLIYSNRFAPSTGASGVATAEDALAGRISSDSGGAGEPGAPSTGGGGSTNITPAELTAMTAECGAAPACAAGQVAVEVPNLTANPSTGAVGAAIDIAESDPAPGPAVPPAPERTLTCAEAPPSCPSGQSPQWSIKKMWECTDCSLVVTYGGIYGNYRRCVGSPKIECPAGEVPTWQLEEDAWLCKPTCDNGLYDQHTIEGKLVCVPC